jgi:hypothetical protein
MLKSEYGKKNIFSLKENNEKKWLKTKITQIKKREKNHEVQFSTNQILNDKIKKKTFKKKT